MESVLSLGTIVDAIDMVREGGAVLCGLMVLAPGVCAFGVCIFADTAGFWSWVWTCGSSDPDSRLLFGITLPLIV